MNLTKVIIFIFRTFWTILYWIHKVLFVNIVVTSYWSDYRRSNETSESFLQNCEKNEESIIISINKLKIKQTIICWCWFCCFDLVNKNSRRNGWVYCRIYYYYCQCLSPTFLHSYYEDFFSIILVLEWKMLDNISETRHF